MLTQAYIGGLRDIFSKFNSAYIQTSPLSEELQAKKATEGEGKIHRFHIWMNSIRLVVTYFSDFACWYLQKWHHLLRRALSHSPILSLYVLILYAALRFHCIHSVVFVVADKSIYLNSNTNALHWMTTIRVCKVFLKVFSVLFLFSFAFRLVIQSHSTECPLSSSKTCS